jgi:hypothetical protein
MKALKKAIEYLPDFPSSDDADQKVRTEFSKMNPNEEVDAWGMARLVSVEPLRAEQVLNQLVQEGVANKEGNWYSLKIEAQLIKDPDEDSIDEDMERQVAEAYKKAIKAVFGDMFEDREIEESVWPGDPHGWAEGSLTTISFENGLASPYYSTNLMEAWFQVDDEASKLLPFNVYNELVNPAVAGVWKA